MAGTQSSKVIKIEALVLAAGYATRLYPLTENTPKPLLEVAGKVMIEHILDKIEELKEISKIYIITNNKFTKNFLDWEKKYSSRFQINIINDGTSSNDDRLGSIGDIQFAIKNKKISDDILVVAGDNIFDFSLKEMLGIFKNTKSDVIALYDVNNKELAKNYGVVSVKNGIIAKFVEKPQNPESTLISTGIYMFQKKTLRLMQKYIDEGSNPDKSGSFIEWLHKKEQVYAHEIDKEWYDIGTLEQLEKADKTFNR